MSLHQEITEKIIAELEAGRVPWVQPWGTAAAKASLAMSKNAAKASGQHAGPTQSRPSRVRTIDIPSA
jgi:antirestriction protein ArdC